MTRYTVVIEHEGDAWGAYAPDLPGCGVAGDSRSEVEELIREAVPMHVESLRERGEEVPAPGSSTSVVEVG